MVNTLLFMLTQAQKGDLSVLKLLAPKATSLGPWSPRETPIGMALAVPVSPDPHTVGLSNGLGEWLTGVDASGRCAVQLEIDKEFLGLGGTPGRAMVATKIEVTTLVKPFSVAGYPWPPRGETLRITFQDPRRPGVTAEVKADMLDGYPNIATQVTLNNQTAHPLFVGKWAFTRREPGLTLDSVGGETENLSGRVDTFLKPGSSMTLPRIVSAGRGLGGERWPSGFWTTVAPWTADRKVLAWIRATDAASARQLVARAAQLGFQGVVVSIEKGDINGILATTATEASAKGMASGFVLDAAETMPSGDFAKPGDGHPCRTTSAAQRSVDRALEWVARSGMQYLVDATDWSLDCRNPAHEAHQSDSSFGWSDQSAQSKLPLTCVVRGVRLYSRRDVRLIGASGVLHHAWSPAPQTSAEFAAACLRPVALVPLTLKSAVPDPQLKYWVWVSKIWSTGLAYPFATRAAQGRLTASGLQGGLSLAVWVMPGKRSGVEGDVWTDLPEGTVLTTQGGPNLKVGAGGVVHVSIDVPPGAAKAFTYRKAKA